MAFTPALIGTATGVNVTSLAIHASGVVQAGGRIYVAVCLSIPYFTDVVDDAGNIYIQAGGSQTDIGVYFLQCIPNLRLGNNAAITLLADRPFSGSIGAFSVTGLASGTLHGLSAGQGNDQDPSAALDHVAADDWLLGVVGVAGSSSDGFTQSPGFANPGNFNSQVTTGFSAYAGYLHNTAPDATVIFHPHLGVSRSWIALLTSISG